jgi:hypothetical protein
LPQIIKRIDAGGVPIIPVDLHGVAAHQFCAFRFERLDSQHGKWAGRLLGQSGSPASRAGALVPQVAVRVGAGVAIRPLHRQRIIAPGEFNALGHGLGISGHARGIGRSCHRPIGPSTMRPFGVLYDAAKIANNSLDCVSRSCNLVYAG